MYALLVLTALAQAPDPAPMTAGTMPPEQVLATIDGKGKLTIVHVTGACYGPGQMEHNVTVPKEKVPVKVKTTSVMMTTVELPAKHVEAFTVDGKAITAETLATLLGKERTVLLAMDGKKVDPFFLSLYKDGTIVLVPPANTLGMGFGGFVGGYGGGPSVVPVPVPAPAPDLPPKPLPPDRNRDR